MNSFALHPNVYATSPTNGLLRMLEDIWVRSHSPGAGTIYVVSGFANYNGGVRFFEPFRRHVDQGGRVVSIFGGSAAQKLTSKQIVTGMLEVGAEVYVVNRKRLLHAKMYGSSSQLGDQLVVSSGNFTGPGMSLNVEASLQLSPLTTREMGFAWQPAVESLFSQGWEVYEPTLSDQNAPVWQLLYDEYSRDLRLDESEETTLILRLGHADTVRIQADPGSEAGKGTQYFWLSRDCYGFFPPLSIRNQRGHKTSFSCIVKMYYMDLDGLLDDACRVTFEAENNLDFRLGTRMLRHTRAADRGDLAAISRIGEDAYQLRIFRQNSTAYRLLCPYAVHEIGHQGKRYGYLENSTFSQISGVDLQSAGG